MEGTSSITSPSEVGIVGRAPAVDEKVCCFCLFVTLWNYKICDNGNAMKRCNFLNNYGVIVQREVCSCAPIFNFFCRPQNFPLGAHFYPKLEFFFAILGAVNPHFKATTMKFGMIVRTWGSLSQAKICRNRRRGIPFLNKFIPQNTNFGDFVGCMPTFFKPQR